MFSPSRASCNLSSSLSFFWLAELIDSYLNGPRTLSAQRLSCIFLSQESDRSHSRRTHPDGPVQSTQGEDWFNYDLLLCTTHFIGDGMALHQCANDFFTLLSSNRSTEELHDILKEQWQIRYGSQFSVSARADSFHRGCVKQTVAGIITS